MIPAVVREHLRDASGAVRINILCRAYMNGELSEYALRRTFPKAWQFAGHGQIPGDLRVPLLLMEVLARRYGVITDSSRAWARQPEIITLYRGGFGPGPCWTLRPEVAEQFVKAHANCREMARYCRERGIRASYEDLKRFDQDGNPQVLSGRFPRERVIGFFSRRGEAEVVVDEEAWTGKKLRLRRPRRR